MTDTKTKKAFIVKDFKDAGSETNYSASTAGQPDTMPMIEVGAFANYEAAGLVRVPTAEDKGVDTATKAKAAAK